MTLKTGEKSHDHLHKHEPCDYTWGNDTTTTQLSDAVVNKPFKDHLKQLYNECPWKGITL
jgi:hypothetical protein